MEQTGNQKEVQGPMDVLLAHQGKAQGALFYDMMERMAAGPSHGIGPGDLKTVYSVFTEMVHAFQFFEPYTGIKKISVFGSARTSPDEPIYAYAADFAKRMTQANFMVITGAGDGIMRAVQGGAGREKSFGINILLPFEQAANEFIANDPKLITFKYFFTRKLFFVKEANALAFFPGGFGTHDEGFEALTLLQTGKSNPLPIVFVDVPGGTHWKDWFSYMDRTLLQKALISPEDLKLFKVTDQIEEAVFEITHFYRNYHSIEYKGDKTVIRLKCPLSDAQRLCLNDLFADIVTQGEIVETDPTKEDDISPDVTYCLLFHFDRRHFGRLREMINTINDFTL